MSNEWFLPACSDRALKNELLERKNQGQRLHPFPKGSRKPIELPDSVRGEFCDTAHSVPHSRFSRADASSILKLLKTPFLSRIQSSRLADPPRTTRAADDTVFEASRMPYFLQKLVYRKHCRHNHHGRRRAESTHSVDSDCTGTQAPRAFHFDIRVCPDRGGVDYIDTDATGEVVSDSASRVND